MDIKKEDGKNNKNEAKQIKRNKTYKYSEIEKEDDLDEQVINDVLNKTKKN